MKVYFLKFQYDAATPDDHSIDLTESGGKLVSDVIDLYDNMSYRNYSVTKSDYGSITNHRTWFGMKESGSESYFTVAELEDSGSLGEIETDSGFLTFDPVDASLLRFVDTTGRIDLVSTKVVSDHNPQIHVFNSDLNDDSGYETEWEHRGPFTEAEEIAFIGANRFLKVEFDLGGVDPTGFEAFIRVEVDRTVMTPLYRHIRVLANKFPEWMKLHSLPEQDIEDPTVLEPTSVGMRLLNSLAGEWLDDAQQQITYRDFQKFIGTIDLNQMAWDYETRNIPHEIYSVKGDGVELARAHDYEEYLKLSADHACFIDQNDDVIFVTQEYDVLEINGVPRLQSSHQVWNYLDEIGALVSLQRLPLESNHNYQLRIRDVFINRGGVGVESLKFALRRELDLWRYEGATPDSWYEGATPEILDIEDLERDPKYFDPDGMPTRAFIEFVEKISREYPTTWGRFRWGKALWDTGGEDNKGYDVVPYRYDAEIPDTVESGVGDGNDLFVFRPDVLTGPREFDARLKLRGRERTVRQEYRPVDFSVQVRGSGTKDIFDHPEKTVWLTVEVDVLEPVVDTVLHSFEVTAKSDAPDNLDPSQATAESYGIYEVFSSDDASTLEDIIFVSKTDGEDYQSETIDIVGVVDNDHIDEVRLLHGRWDGTSYVDKESDDTFEAWFSHDDLQVLSFNTPSGSEPTFVKEEEATPEDPSDPQMVLDMPFVVMRSLVVESATPQQWYSDPVIYDVTVNDLEPYLNPRSTMVELHEILWDPDAYDIEIELMNLTTNPFEETVDEFGGLTTDEDGNVYFLPEEYIDIDLYDEGATPTSPTAFSSGIVIVEDETGIVEFSIDSATIENEEGTITYPVDAYTWVPFESESSSTTPGIVDENGPWRNNKPQRPGNSNYVLEVFESVSRDDFGVPNDDDHVITWMGVATNNTRTTVWLDSNTVQPHEQDDDAEYPPDSIEEFLDSGTYYYGPVVIKARLKPGVAPQWYPQVHSGYFYDKDEEYYFYAQRKEEVTDQNEFVLESVVRQGAPVIILTDEIVPTHLRQVAFYDLNGEAELTLRNKQHIVGNGTEVLYLAYRDVYDVEVRNEEGDLITAETEDATNPGQIVLNDFSDFDITYEVSYVLRNSFFVDNDYIDGDGENRSRIVFDSAPAGGATQFIINYEESDYDPATPVDVPLNSLYTIQTRGFVYISFNEYNLESVTVHMSPAHIIADGVDMIMITIHSVDENGNPKPNQEFTLSTDFGTLEHTEVTTDEDGFAVVNLYSDDEFTSETGEITITGDVNATVEFNIEEAQVPEPFLHAVPKKDQIEADGQGYNLIFGKVYNADQTTVGEDVPVHWKRSRSIYGLFHTSGIIEDSGTVYTHEDGSFEIGPFQVGENEDSGYWFVAVETEVDDVEIGDVVVWFEYPEIRTGVENADGFPVMADQMYLEPGANPLYYNNLIYQFPYTEEEPVESSTPSVEWLPPSWYAVPAFLQWKMGVSTNKTYKQV